MIEKENGVNQCIEDLRWEIFERFKKNDEETIYFITVLRSSWM